MKYKLADLIDIGKFQKLMKEFYSITQIPHGLLDAEGNILSGIGWQDVCTKFHRMNKRSVLRCKESDLTVSNLEHSKEKFVLYKCKNGLMEAAVPIIVEDNYMGMLCLGQFLYEEPDIHFFRNQAEEFGYEVNTYMEAVSQIPIFTKEKVGASMAYFFHLADMLSSMGLDRLKQRESEKLLIKVNEKLEEEVAKRTNKLAIANNKLKEDINKLQAMERKLKESKEKYRTLIEIMPDSIIVHKEEIVIFANPAFARLVGIEDYRDVIGRNMFEFIHPDDRVITKERVEYVKNGQDIPLRQLRLVSVDGNTIIIEATGRLISFEGEKIVLAVGRDISERKRVERLQKKVEEEQRVLKEAREYDKLKMEFFANLSHEFRTPLNLIHGTIQLFEQDIEEKLSNEEILFINKRMKILKQNTYRLLRLANNLLDITRIDSGYFELQLDNCNIVSLVEDITMSVVEYIKSKDIKVLFDTNIEISIIAIDQNLLERIILNLLSNAVKFSKAGGEIFVKVYDTDKYIFISVKDTGIGIPQDKLQIVFNRFRQVNKTLARNHEGSGIGLSLVKALVELHNGEIAVKSQYNKGSEFIIKLPKIQISKDIERSFDINDTNKSIIELIDIEFSDIYLLNDY